MSVSARDYSTISPSALSLLWMKARTSIPFAKQAAKLLWGDTVPSELSEAMAEPNALRRSRHFANRYYSLDQLLEDSESENVIELGAGLSFRGLELARRRKVFYFDTDLPDIAVLKASLVAKLHPGPLLGTVRVAPLNALDGAAFAAAVDAMPPGPLTLVNEGLLVYLDANEKAALAANVRRALEQRGGSWLTADVYVQNSGGSAPTAGYGRSRAFLDSHRVEQNKFSDWASAERYFVENGFRIVKKLAHEHPRHVRQTWALTLARARD